MFLPVSAGNPVGRLGDAGASEESWGKTGEEA